MRRSTLVIAAIAAVVAAPSFAEQKAPAESSFVHQGVTYIYTAETKGSVRIIKGKTSDGEYFTLRATPRQVSGDFGQRAIAFPTKSVKPIGLEVAAR